MLFITESNLKLLKSWKDQNYFVEKNIRKESIFVSFFYTPSFQCSEGPVARAVYFQVLRVDFKQLQLFKNFHFHVRTRDGVVNSVWSMAKHDGLGPVVSISVPRNQH